MFFANEPAAADTLPFGLLETFNISIFPKLRLDNTAMIKSFLEIQIMLNAQQHPHVKLCQKYLFHDLQILYRIFHYKEF
jgi:hypothetical protein